MPRTTTLVIIVPLLILAATTGLAAGDCHYRQSIVQGKEALQQKDLGKAFACFEAATALAVGHALGDRAEGRARYYLGITLGRQGRYVAAERTLRGALGLLIAHFGPEHRSLTPVLKRLAWLAHHNGRTAEARRLLAQAQG